MGIYFRDILLTRISRGANNCGQHPLEKNSYFIMRFSPHFQLFYFNDRLEFCNFFEGKIKRINNADLFSQLPLLIFIKGANISGGHCIYIYIMVSQVYPGNGFLFSYCIVPSTLCNNIAFIIIPFCPLFLSTRPQLVHKSIIPSLCLNSSSKNRFNTRVKARRWLWSSLVYDRLRTLLQGDEPLKTICHKRLNEAL